MKGSTEYEKTRLAFDQTGAEVTAIYANVHRMGGKSMDV